MRRDPHALLIELYAITPMPALGVVVTAFLILVGIDGADVGVLLPPATAMPILLRFDLRTPEVLGFKIGKG